MAVSIHNGHRARKRKQFYEHGLESFSDYEALEFLLYFALPRVDTNPIAHRLIDRFGSLDGVFSASAYELARVEGVGENAAALVALIYPLIRFSSASPPGAPETLDSVSSTGQYFKKLFFGVREERVYEACLDSRNNILRCVEVSDGSADTVTLNMRRIVELALQCGASSVILSHNHPSGVALPSCDDGAATLQIWRALKSVGIKLQDHIIVADTDFVSMRHNGFMPHE